MFNNILGQEQPKALFGDIIKKRKLAHAYIFSGPEGVGKFLFAQELAKALLCEKGTGCGKCRSCLRTEHKNHPALNILSVPEKKKNIPIEAVRELEHEIALKPFEGRYKIFIINNAETLSEEATNAILKTLEEPPPYSLIILISSKPESLLPTILSRCHLIRFYPLPESALKGLLSKSIKGKLTEAELKILIALSGGSAGQALELYEKGFIPHRQKLIRGALQPSSALTEDIIGFAKREKENEDIRTSIIRQLKIISLALRDLMLLNLGIGDDKTIFNYDNIVSLNKAKGLFPLRRVSKAIETIIQAEQYIRLNMNYNLVVTNTVINI
ncbi:MAG: DNA polymerase III subunit delta' [Planctomycetes bacterium]|nr:DNA polymerase III subunit delta' [Planctomycetota bacterium]